MANSLRPCQPQKYIISIYTQQQQYKAILFRHFMYGAFAGGVVVVTSFFCRLHVKREFIFWWFALVAAIFFSADSVECESFIQFYCCCCSLIESKRKKIKIFDGMPLVEFLLLLVAFTFFSFVFVCFYFKYYYYYFMCVQLVYLCVFCVSVMIQPKLVSSQSCNISAKRK